MRMTTPLARAAETLCSWYFIRNTTEQLSVTATAAVLRSCSQRRWVCCKKCFLAAQCRLTLFGETRLRIGSLSNSHRQYGTKSYSLAPLFEFFQAPLQPMSGLHQLKLSSWVGGEHKLSEVGSAQ
jgi:hypothetical protein